jgi:diguanylate cyclase (GGDEF)-like protein
VRLGGGRTAWRLFLAYAVATLVPVAALGVVLSYALAQEAQRRGVGEGRAVAALLARTAVEPLLDGRDLKLGLSTVEWQSLRRMTDRAIVDGSVLRLQLRDRSGRVVFADDSGGPRTPPAPAEIESEALDAAGGATMAHLTRLNSDADDVGPAGERAVEVYLPLTARGTRVGVLEVYLPYDPIDADVSAGLRTLYVILGLGLLALWALLAGISVSTMRRLRQAVARNAYLADHDPLTGLPNRELFRRHATEAIVANGRVGAQTAVVVVDLDRFKEVNDSLGHRNGDVLLRELGNRLTECARAEDTVARLGGDEFGLVLTADTEAEVLGRLDCVRDLFEREMLIEGLPVTAEASFGYALAPADGSDAESLLRRADVAMYTAKESRTGPARYDSLRDHYDAGKLALVSELRRAIESGELVLHFQPKAQLRTGEIRAVEALVRWQHPERGLLMPIAFLPVAEQTGLIEPLTRWVLDAALREVRSWGDRFDGLTMAVNVSARNLSRADFANTALGALYRTGVAPRRLIVEITETALLTEPDTAAAVLDQLTRAGVRVSIDDFGQGQTSLGYLPSLPLYEIKIDRSFVADLPANLGHQAIVRSIVDLGHRLGLQVVAEGVETAEVVRLLDAAGCDIIQGYLLARPMPSERLAEWLSDRGVAGDRARVAIAG